MNPAILFDEVFLKHRADGYHPERPKRLMELRKAIYAAGYWDRARILPAREATPEELARVHDKSYIKATLDYLRGGWGHLDPDTFFSPDSKAAALGAAGGSIDLVREVFRRQVDVGLALVRPPGHHAEANRAAGFCIFNNIAVATAALLADGVERILIFDWDVHHGNGTQHEFEKSNTLPIYRYINGHIFQDLASAKKSASERARDLI